MHLKRDNQFKDFSKRLLQSHHSVSLEKRDLRVACSPQSNRTSNASLGKTVTSSVKTPDNCYKFTFLPAHPQHQISKMLQSMNLQVSHSLPLQPEDSPSFQVNAMSQFFTVWQSHHIFYYLQCHKSSKLLFGVFLGV